MDSKTLIQNVHNRYAAVARSKLSNDSAAVRSVAQAFGYSEDDLASLPPQANMGLSCGNPVAVAGLRAGEVVVDLGCGGGLDVLLAARQVGPTGKAIGIDMTLDMLDRARVGAARVGATNVEFHRAQIDALPLPDSSVDCILSNCVINLVPDKKKAFGEILRVLKPGGRVSISDIALRQPLPPDIATSIQAYVGCIGGAILIADYKRLLSEAGFDAVVVMETGADLNVYAQAGSGGCCSKDGSCGSGTPPLHDGLAKVLKDFDANAYAASVRVHAVKSNPQTTIQSDKGETPMSRIEIYDKPMCCSTGVCGPQVDPVLPRFAADLEWLKSQGNLVERFNLSQQPQAFVENRAVHELLETYGTDCLPVIVVDGRLKSRSGYPSREMLALWTGSGSDPAAPREIGGGACCGRERCC